MLAALETRAKKAEALAAEFKSGTSAGPVFRLGQRVVHRVHGYRWGVPLSLCARRWGVLHVRVWGVLCWGLLPVVYTPRAARGGAQGAQLLDGVCPCTCVHAAAGEACSV